MEEEVRSRYACIEWSRVCYTAASERAHERQTETSIRPAGPHVVGHSRSLGLYAMFCDVLRLYDGWLRSYGGAYAVLMSQSGVLISRVAHHPRHASEARVSPLLLYKERAPTSRDDRCPRR